MSDELTTDTDLDEVPGSTAGSRRRVQDRLPPARPAVSPHANVDAATTSKFKAISQAYFVLSNPERRAEYDKSGTLFTKEYRA